MTTTDWRTRASCRREDPDLFFPAGTPDDLRAQTEAAKAICRRCPVADACLQAALLLGSVAGVWGGTSVDDRRLLLLAPAAR